MSIPSDAVLQDIIDDVIPLGFLSGTDATIALAAMETAVDIGQRGLGTNLLQTGTDCEIQADACKVKILVLATNEELVVARETMRLLKAGS